MSAQATKEHKMPSQAELEKMRESDEGYNAAKTDPVGYLESRQKAVYKISRNYHLDGEELFQEGYEVLLTCLRDFSPVYQKANGDVVNVQFTTFFGNRMESRAMEMRNTNPEYQARQAYTEGLGENERQRFKEDPPLLVQHLDHESAMQETLRGEASVARGSGKEEIAMKIARDSYFEQTLDKLVAKETDEKKKAALLHVKVGGVYNFQEIAYHFGVTDSRASQVMNELMDAFYVQRMIDADLQSVSRDFQRLRFNEKRAVRLISEAYAEASKERQAQLKDVFEANYASLAEALKNVKPVEKKAPKKEAAKQQNTTKQKVKAPAYNDVFTEEENKKYPLVGVELRNINKLVNFEDFDFHRPESEDEFIEYTETHEFDDGLCPAIISDNGCIIDGARRIQMAKEAGRSDYMCIVRKVDDEKECKQLRVAVNLRQIKPTKLDLYHAICALADLGLSQQKISDIVGTSRTNVLVYVKVRDKAGPQLRALFEDGLIQVTNASSCADLDDATQAKLANFIRKYGPAWSKGGKFNDLYGAAATGDLDTFIATKSDGLEPVEQPSLATETTKKADEQGATVSSRAVQVMQERINVLEASMKDKEVWDQRREGVINQQREALEAAQEEAEQLRRELEAAELMQFGNPKAIEDELKNLKQFYGVTERLSGASHALSSASKDIRKLSLRRKQGLELKTLLEELEQQMNAVRIELVNVTKG